MSPTAAGPGCRLVALYGLLPPRLRGSCGVSLLAARMLPSVQRTLACALSVGRPTNMLRCSWTTGCLYWCKSQLQCGFRCDKAIRASRLESVEAHSYASLCQVAGFNGIQYEDVLQCNPSSHICAFHVVHRSVHFGKTPVLVCILQDGSPGRAYQVIFIVVENAGHSRVSVYSCIVMRSCTAVGNWCLWKTSATTVLPHVQSSMGSFPNWRICASVLLNYT